MEAFDLPDFSLQQPKKEHKQDLESMTQAELLALRDKIDEKLTGIHLKDVNLVQEVLIQLKKAKILQNKANSPGRDFPINQLAQVQNSIAKILNDLARLQNTLFDSEQRKRLQQATIKTVRAMPQEMQDKFFELYEPVLEEAEKRMGDTLPEDSALPDPEPDEEEGDGAVS